MRKKLTALLLLAVILITYIPRTKAVGSIWFIAVNDSVPTFLTDETEPFLDGNTLYIPYTAFRAKPFGISISYNEDKKERLTLFNRVKRLTIDLIEEISTDKDGVVHAVNVVFRNGAAYFPSDCLSYFGIDVTLLMNSDGYLVLRFTNGAQTYDDDVLLAKAESLIKDRAERYDNGTLPPESDLPDIQKPDDGNTFQPGEEPDGYAYVAFYGDAVSELSLKLLETETLHAAFFLTLEQIQQDPELVRMLYAAGNTVALTVTGAETDLQSALDQANRALDETIFRKTILALLPEDRASEVHGYRVLSIPNTNEHQPQTPPELPDDISDSGSMLQYLVIDEANINNTISKLWSEKISILQLRECTALPE